LSADDKELETSIRDLEADKYSAEDDANNGGNSLKPADPVKW
jgi:hypothetical protein